MFLVIYIVFTVNKNIKKETIINKSRFIACLYKVNDVLEANNIINEVKKEYKDATHFPFAYIIGNIKRFNDDGEPKSTAGMPILNVLENKNLTNVLVIVIRYFGGIKLGAGGLTRAYSNSVSSAIKDENIVSFKKIVKKRIEFKYDVIKEVNYILKEFNVTYKEYDDNVIYEFEYEENNYPKELESYILKK